MLPVVIRSAEVVLLLVPDALREAALALGAPRWRVILRIVLPTALPGLVTGVLLAVARAAGETAPLLFTARLVNETNFDLGEFMNSLPVQIFTDVTTPTTAGQHRAWGAALTLVALILLLTLIARLLARRSDRMTPDRPTTPMTEPSNEQINTGASSPPADGPRPAPRRRTGDPRRPPRATGSRVRGLHAFYGDLHSGQGRHLDFAPNQVTAIIGPSGCGKSTMVRCINRMHEEIPGARAEGEVLLDDTTSTTTASTSSRCAARSAWSSRSPTRSRRCRSSTTSRPGCG